MELNAGAWRVVEEMLARLGALAAACHGTPSGVRVVDCGTRVLGSIQAGIMLSRAALADLGQVAVDAGGMASWPDCSWPVVHVSTDWPVAACLASQYAGWRVKSAGYFAMASGPIRAAIGREALFDTIGMRERSPCAVGVLEASRLPPHEVCETLAREAQVDPTRLALLVAPSASIAGTVQVVARSLETALHKLHDLGFDLTRVRRGSGHAPLPPVPEGDDLAAIGRTNDAILYGAHVVLEVSGDEESLFDIGPRMVSSASSDYGTPFRTLFERAGRDFYALDPALFAPAVVELISSESGRRRRFGRIEAEVVHGSFTADASASGA